MSIDLVDNDSKVRYGIEVVEDWHHVPHEGMYLNPLEVLEAKFIVDGHEVMARASRNANPFNSPGADYWSWDVDFQNLVSIGSNKHCTDAPVLVEDVLRDAECILALLTFPDIILDTYLAGDEEDDEVGDVG
jgi:hypothetical protein